MACNCIEKTEERLREKVLENINPKSTVDGYDGVSTEFKNTVFNLAAGDFSPLVLKYGATYRRRKTDGSAYKNETKDEYNIAMSYCPFCGTKFEGEEATQ